MASEQSSRPDGRLRATVAVLAVLLLARLLWVPLHLTLERHDELHAAAGALEQLADHGRDHPHPDGDHVPHPSADHLDEEFASRSSHDQAPAWIEARPATRGLLRPRARGLAPPRTASTPRPPPPRASRARAPPLG